MLRLNVNNETSKLKAVVLGIGNSLGSVPTVSSSLTRNPVSML